MKRGLSLMVALSAVVVAGAFTVTACKGQDSLSKGATEVSFSTGINAAGNYDDSLFYRNDLTAEGADPGAVYCEEDGYWYVFVTGLDYYRTKDFINYEEMGKAIDFDSSSWSYVRRWAPECIKYDGKYWLYYSAASRNVKEINSFDSLRIGVAVADTAAGPFVDWTGDRTLYYRDQNGNRIKDDEGNDVTYTEHYDGKTHPFEFLGNSPLVAEMGVDNFANIDANPFVDDNGDLYLYFNRHIDRNNNMNSVYGVKMINPYTPDYDTLTYLAEPGKKTVGGAACDYESSININEGPFVVAHTSVKPDGEKVKKYYMTYSVGGYSDPRYSVATAVSDSPLGTFTKLDGKYNQPFHGIDADFDHAAATGHHQILTVGDDEYILYHAATDRRDAGKGRSVALDRVHWKYHEELGYDILYSDGPTYSLQPLPYSISGYKNVAAGAKVTVEGGIAEGSSSAWLNDGLVPINFNDTWEFRSSENSVTITLEFPKAVKLKAIMAYNSRDIDYAFSKVDFVRLYTENGDYFMRDIAFPEEYVSPSRMRPGGAAIAEFSEVAVTKVTLRFTHKLAEELTPGVNSPAGIGIGEIVLLGSEKN